MSVQRVASTIRCLYKSGSGVRSIVLHGGDCSLDGLVVAAR